jgi:hypothetical protein
MLLVKEAGLAAVCAVAVLVGGRIAVGTQTTTSPLDELHDPLVQQELMFSLASPGSASAAALSRDQAIAIASAWLGRTDAPLLASEGTGRSMAQDADLQVWVVAYSGGDPPPGGLPGAGPVRVSFTGVVIDDSTGIILRTFGYGH